MAQNNGQTLYIQLVTFIILKFQLGAEKISNLKQKFKKKIQTFFCEPLKNDFYIS